MKHLALIVGLQALSTAVAAPATTAPASDPVSAGSPAAAAAGLSTSLVQVGRATVDPATRTVLVTGFVNQVEGIVELLACGTGGKRHESVFVLQAAAVDLQAALLLIGATNGPPMAELGKGPPVGSQLSVDVQLGTGGTGAVHAAAVYLRHTEKGPLPPDTPWVFTGSMEEQGEFKASIEESFVASYWDPWAIINIGSAMGAEDDFLAVNRDAVPPLETPVTFLIRCRP